MGFFSKWRLLVTALTQKESKDRILGQPCLQTSQNFHTTTLWLCAQWRGERCDICKTWPGNVRRKPELTADIVQCPLINHLVASHQCCESHTLFYGLLLTENCHCLHPHMPAVFTLLPIRFLKDGYFVCCCKGVVSHHVMLWFSLTLTNLAVIRVNLPAAVNKNASIESGVGKAKVHKWCFRHQRRPRHVKPPAFFWETSCSLPSSLCLGKSTRKSWVKMSRRH